MASTTHTIRIVDARQSKGPNVLHPIAFIILGPGALMWPGVALNSSAMQWAGFILFLIFIFMLITRWLDEFCTPEEARKKIDEIEGLNQANDKTST